MSNEKDISLQSLKNHEVVPPAFLFDEILKKTKVIPVPGMNNLSQLKDLPLPAPSHLKEAIFEEINEINKLKIFSQLKDHRIPPPDELYNKIHKNIYYPKKTLQKGRLIHMKSFFKVAAAVIFIVGGGYFFGRMTFNTKEDRLQNIVFVPKIVPAQPTQIDTSEKISPVVARKEDTYKKPPQKNEIIKKAAIARTTPPVSNIVMEIDGTSYIFMNNDILASFASFDPNKLPQFLLKENNEATLVTVNNFTAVNVSPGMAEILRRMYKLKKNGNPTWNALRQQKKLQQWKKTDASFFDANSTNNPFNPIDLGNFILDR